MAGRAMAVEVAVVLVPGLGMARAEGMVGDRGMDRASGLGRAVVLGLVQLETLDTLPYLVTVVSKKVCCYCMTLLLECSVGDEIKRGKLFESRE